jgi:hypothetical protein
LGLVGGNFKVGTGAVFSFRGSFPSVFNGVIQRHGMGLRTRKWEKTRKIVLGSMGTVPKEMNMTMITTPVSAIQNFHDCFPVHQNENGNDQNKGPGRKR